MTQRNKIIAVVLTLMGGVTLAAVLPVYQPDALPEEYLGRWYFVASGGGFSGDGAGGEAGSSIVITADNQIEYYRADGTPTDAESFMLSRGESIYSGREAWLLDPTSDVPRVIERRADGTLSIADNVYDGFDTTYRRTR